MDALTRVVRVLGHCHSDQTAPIYVRLLQAAAHVRSGGSREEACSLFRVRELALAPLLADGVDPIEVMFGHPWELPLSDEHVKKARGAARKNAGQLLLGRMAERVFEQIYKTEMGGEDLRLEDDRKSRNDTDYRLVDGQGRPAFRINIKFHGTEFQKAKDLVSLDPSDCFALATYKIHQGLKKEEDEHLPFLFVVASALGLSGESIGDALPEDAARVLTLVRLAEKVPGLKKRDVEDGIVTYLLGPEAPEEFLAERERVAMRLATAEWRVLSAKKGDKLLRDLLFDRVYAVRVQRFAQNYRNAELNMHFSLSSDLTPLTTFLQSYKTKGLHGLTSELSRGYI